MDTRSIPETVGVRMKNSRRKAGLSVQYMADHYDVKVATIRSWEQSVHTPRDFLGRLTAWAELCDVSLGWLLAGDANLFTYGGSRRTFRSLNLSDVLTDSAA